MDGPRYADAAHRIAPVAARGRIAAKSWPQFIPDPALAAQAKILASEAAIKIVNEALQVFGMRSYSRDFPL